MGIYPEERYYRQNGLLYRTYNDFSGLVTTEVYDLIVTHEERTTCYCCSCPEDGSDSLCRNHNMGFGMRPCERHGTPGQSEINWDKNMEEYDTGVIPPSREWERARQDWQANFWEQLHPADTLTHRAVIWPCAYEAPHSHWRSPRLEVES